MRRFMTASALFITMLATPAIAQPVVYTAPPPLISAIGAQDIAMSNGVVGIHKIELDDGVWEIEGRATDGARVEMKIDRRTGAIVELERYY